MKTIEQVKKLIKQTLHAQKDGERLFQALNLHRQSISDWLDSKERDFNYFSKDEKIEQNQQAEQFYYSLLEESNSLYSSNTLLGTQFSYKMLPIIAKAFLAPLPWFVDINDINAVNTVFDDYLSPIAKRIYTPLVNELVTSSPQKILEQRPNSRASNTAALINAIPLNAKQAATESSDQTTEATSTNNAPGQAPI